MGYWVQDTSPKKRTEIFVKEMQELYEILHNHNS